jgi:hypothetical protein
MLQRRSVGQSVLVSITHLGLTTRFLLLSDSCGFVDVGRFLWRENVSAVYNCCWSSPARSFMVQSPSALVTIFYCLRFEIRPTWVSTSQYLYTLGTGWPSYTPRHWVPFSSPPATRRATVEVFEPASTRESATIVLKLTSRHGRRRENTFRALYPSNSSIIIEMCSRLPLQKNDNFYCCQCSLPRECV